jgi:Ca-activated chloride channel family protein
MTTRSRATRLLTRTGRLAAFAAILGAGTAPALALGRTPVFESGVELVNLTVTVTDAQSEYVRGLTQADFEVLEDGVPQALALFTERDVPLSVVVLLDTSLSMQGKLARAQEAARRFVRTLDEGDTVQVVAFNERPTIVQDFTGDRALLESAITGTRPGGATALYNSVYVALKDLRARRKPDELRREAVIVLSDGDDTSSVVSDDQVLETARRAGIPVYGIRLPQVAEAAAARARGPNQTGFFFASLTRDTGGQVQMLRSLGQLGGVYDRLAQELRAQYSLGYVSSNARHDGRWRSVVVRLKSAAHRLRHRLGYYAQR